MSFPEALRNKRICTTNSLINALNNLETTNLKVLETLTDRDQGSLDFANDFDAIDVLNSLKFDDVEKYEEKEKEIPNLIYEILKKESNTFTKLVKRDYLEEDAWLVSVECKESEYLEDNGQEVYTSSKDGELVPMLLDYENAAIHFVKIHVPKIFVRTISLPMIYRNH